MTLKKRDCTGNLNRRHQIALCGKIALEGPMDLSYESRKRRYFVVTSYVYPHVQYLFYPILTKTFLNVPYKNIVTLLPLTIGLFHVDRRTDGGLGMMKEIFYENCFAIGVINEYLNQRSCLSIFFFVFVDSSFLNFDVIVFKTFQNGHGILKAPVQWLPGIQRPGCEFDQSSPSSAEVMNDCIRTFAPIIWLHGVHRADSSYYLYGILIKMYLTFPICSHIDVVKST